MKSRTPMIALTAVAVLTAAGGAAYWLGMQRGMGTSSAAAPATSAPATAAIDPSTWTTAQGEAATRRHLQEGLKAGSIDPTTGRPVLYYQDPMAPGKKFNSPGKSPFMDMMLVPVYGGSSNGASAGATDSSSISVSPRVQQNLGLRTAEVSEGTLAPQLSAVGSIVWNERDQAVVQARASGFVERVMARATLDRVAAGQALAEIHVPDWVAAQEEFLALRRMTGADVAPLLDASRARMRQVGMDAAQIARVEASGALQPRSTIVAPIAGVLTEVGARPGMAVMAGATLFRINGTASVWAQAEVPESQAALLRPGAKVRATSPALPGEVFDGRVQTLLPDVNPTTRTLKARLEIANRGGRLVPGMFVQMQFMDLRADKMLLVPSEALIRTGERTVAMLAEDGGRFRPVEVEAGLESGGRTEIKRGLQLGQRVVVSSQFLIDSEASLKGVEARLNAPPPAVSAASGAAGPTQGDDNPSGGRRQGRLGGTQGPRP